MTAITLRPQPLAATASRTLRVLEEECFPIVVLATIVVLVAYVVSSFVVQDTWLALVDGRWIAQHGLPHVDHLTVMTQGERWTDQQWLAQLTLYDLVRIGGYSLLAAGCTAIFALALAACAIGARRAGASARSAALLLPLPMMVSPWALQPRTQTFALPLFAAVYVLLALDSRRPTARVYYVVPLLVLWANLHGSVSLGALLVACHGVLHRRRRALVVLAPLSVVASPYGFSLVHYYRWMLVGAPLRQYILEWRPTAFSPATALFFVASFVVVFALGRSWRRLSRFERVAVPLLLLAALLSVRNTVWVGLAFAGSAPLLIDAAWPARGALRQPLNRVISLASLVLVVPVAAVGLARAPVVIAKKWPIAGARAAARAAGAHGLVLADDDHADWLLWREPQLIGRVGYDVRFELFSGAQIATLAGFRSDASHRSLARLYRVLTFSSRTEAARWRDGRVVRYDAPGFIVVARTRASVDAA